MRHLALLAVVFSAPAFAQDVPVPRERPDEMVAVEPAPVPLPRQRPEALIEEEPGSESGTSRDKTIPEIPEPRIYQAACPAVIRGEVEARMRPPIAEGQCVVRSPLEVGGIRVNGRVVPLAGDPILTCGMAETVRDWAEEVDGYLAARENTRIARILSGTSYACRNRNNAAGGPMSEHGFGNALDVVGFELEDGRTMSLPGGWSEPLSPAGRLLRFSHDAACARFTTTLGPEANALHADHLHLDLGCHGERCVARLCE